MPASKSSADFLAKSNANSDMENWRQRVHSELKAENQFPNEWSWVAERRSQQAMSMQEHARILQRVPTLHRPKEMHDALDLFAKEEFARFYHHRRKAAEVKYNLDNIRQTPRESVHDAIRFPKEGVQSKQPQAATRRPPRRPRHNVTTQADYGHGRNLETIPMKLYFR